MLLYTFVLYEVGKVCATPLGFSWIHTLRRWLHAQIGNRDLLLPSPTLFVEKDEPQSKRKGGGGCKSRLQAGCPYCIASGNLYNILSSWAATGQ